MVSLRNKDKNGDIGNKRGCDDSASTPNKRTRSLKGKDSPGGSSPAASTTLTPESTKTQQDHVDTPMPKHETPVKRQSLRSSHLLVTPAPEVLTTPRRSRRLSTDSTDLPPQVQTPIRRSRRLSTDASENPPPQVQTPIRRSRRLSTDLTENPVEVQTPTRRSRRLSTDLTENPPQLATPTRRSRRLSTDLTENPPQLDTPTRRSRRLSTDLNENPPQTQTTTRRTKRSSTDVNDAVEQLPTPLLLWNSGKEAKDTDDAHSTTSVTHIEVLKNRSKTLSSDVSKTPTSKVQAPTTRRSRRLSTDLVDIPEDDQAPAETEVVSQRNRRLSGKNLAEPESVCEKPLSVLEEVEEEKDEDGDMKILDSTTDDLAAKVNEEKEKETDLDIIEEEDEVIIVDDDEEDISNVRQVCDIEEKSSDIEILPKDHDLNEEDKACEDEEDDIKLILEEETAANKSQGEITEVIEKNSCTQPAGNGLEENKHPQPKTKSVSETKMVTDQITTEETVDSTSSTNSICISSETCNNKEKENSHTEEIVSNSVATVTDIKDKELLENQENQSLASTNNIKPNVNKNEQKSLNNNDEELKSLAIRGKPVSGRWWKKENKRFTSIMKDQGLKSTWAIKMQRKQELKDMLAMKTAIAEEKKRKKAELRERQKLNTIRREENARKAEIVQVIKDSRKIKKMKRKQLRYIETRDTTLLKKA